jgi:hypothetical protein
VRNDQMDIRKSAVDLAVVRISPLLSGFDPTSDIVGLMVNKATLKRVYSTLVSPASSHPTDCSTLTYRSRLVQ